MRPFSGAKERGRAACAVRTGKRPRAYRALRAALPEQAEKGGNSLSVFLPVRQRKAQEKKRRHVRGRAFELCPFLCSGAYEAEAGMKTALFPQSQCGKAAGLPLRAGSAAPAARTGHDARDRLYATRREGRMAGGRGASQSRAPRGGAALRRRTREGRNIGGNTRGFEEQTPFPAGEGVREVPGQGARAESPGRCRCNPKERGKSFHAILHAARARSFGVAHSGKHQNRGKHQNHGYGQYPCMVHRSVFFPCPEGHLREAAPFPETTL